MSDLAQSIVFRPALLRANTYDFVMQVLGGTWFLLLAGLFAWEAIETNSPWPKVLSKLGNAAFFVVLWLLISTRPPAQARAEGLLPRLVAFVGTYMPWTIAFAADTESVSTVLSTACVLGGTILTLITVSYLGKSFSIVPQVRSLVREGPYRWIRHPLYLAEELVVFGILLQVLSPLTALIFVAHVGVQICRILYEEKLLRATLPDYDDIPWRLIPFVW
jgi:protein-S-isoprenylcysteine O-methyltransferase Ste14